MLSNFYSPLPPSLTDLERILLVHTLETRLCAQRILFGFSAVV